MSIKFKLASGTTLFFGNEPVVLPYSTTVEFTKIDSIDALAEILASHPPTYALNRERLSHSETIVDEKGKKKSVNVTYGVGGAKNEGEV